MRLTGAIVLFHFSALVYLETCLNMPLAGLIQIILSINASYSLPLGAATVA